MNFKDNIWTSDLAEMRSLSSKNWNIKSLLYVIDVLTTYGLNSLTDEKGKTFLIAFIKIVNEFNHKRNKLWVDQRR